MDERPPLGPPPRAVPTSLRLRVLFGGILPVVGFAILAIAGPFTLAFAGNSDLMVQGRFAGELWTADGVVTAVERLQLRINHEHVYRVDFRYEVDRREFEASSYADGKPPAPGEAVTVEHVAADPTVARIHGLRSAPLPAAVAAVLVFPLVGLALAIGGMLANRRRLRLLQHGDSAWAILTGREPTRTRVNNQRVHALEFTFVDASGERRVARARSHRSEFFDEQLARHVLYDASANTSCLVDMTPGRPRIVAGEWAAVSPLSLLAVLLLPVLAALGCTLAIVLST